MKITFYGSSDDNFCWEGDINDEVGCYDDIGRARVLGQNGGGLIVIGVYSPKGINGCWAIGVLPLEEDEPLPGDWIMGLSAEGYSARLTIETPGPVKVEGWGEVECVRRGEGWR